MATNLKPLVKKLQMALYIQRGRRISINQYQMYSERAGRTVTKYVLTEYDGSRYKTIYESWILPDVVKFLAAQLNEDRRE